MFGWNIFVANFTVGALFGYSSVNCSVSLNVPPSHGVSSGPNMTACQSMIFDSVGAPEIPVGGSDCSRLKSRTRRLRAGVDMMSRRRRRRLFARQKYVHFPSTQKTKASSFPSSLVALCLSSSTALRVAFIYTHNTKKGVGINLTPSSLSFLLVLVVLLLWWWSFRSVKRNAVVVSFRFVSFEQHDTEERT